MRNRLGLAVVVAAALLGSGLPGSAAETDDSKREQWVAQYQGLQRF